MSPSRPLVRRVLAVTLACAAVASCGGSDDGDRPTASATTAPAGLDTFRARAARACTEAINARDATFTAGREAMLEAAVALRTGEALSADTIDVADVQAVVDGLAATGETLRAVDTSDASEAETAAWDAVIADVDERRAWIEGRVAAVEADDTAAIETAFSAIQPEGVDQAALTTLGFEGLDCTRLLEQEGPADDFQAAAATACADAVQRLRDPDVAAARSSVLSVVAGLVEAEGDPVAMVAGAVDDVAENAAIVAGAATAASASLAAVDAPDDRAEAWSALIATLDETADVAQRRAEAMRDGDTSAIADAFTAGAGATDVSATADAVSSLGLDDRDCSAVG